MRLTALLARVSVRDARGPLDRWIRNLSRDSREVGPDDVFVAIEGATVDGHDLVPGLQVAAVVVARDVVARDGVAVVRVDDTKVALAEMAAALHADPSHDVPLVGVTGTNGKTTVTRLVAGALQALGTRSGHIGTAGNALDGVEEAAAFTTPEAPALQALLRRWVDAGAEVVAMEVSSIGLAQHRVDGCRFHAAAFTNLTQDHLDFHGTLDAYRDAKARLFRDLLRPAGGAPRAVLCADDPAHTAMGAPADRWTYGFAPGSDWHLAEVRVTADGTRLALTTPLGPLALRSPMLGRHNAQNLACAAALLATLGIDGSDIVRGLEGVEGVPGRLERVLDPSGRLVVVDYAHSPDALDHALRTVGDLLDDDGQLFVVFGCGGDRDRGKRPQMGAIAEASGARVVLTSDNPRSEAPEAILEAIAAGMRSAPERVEADRAEAIRYAIHSARPGDAVLIAGKGHETYQEIDGVRHPFDDRVQALRALEAT